MAEHNAVNERHDMYNKITRIKDEGLRKKQEDMMRKKKKIDDAKTTISSEKLES